MSDTQDIKEKLDIVDFVGEYVQLKPAGIHHKGLCPFHQEKSPSFMVSRERHMWHCFGCGKGGDIFTFAQEIEGLEFIEALKLLADRAGVKLQDSGQSKLETSKKNRLKDIHVQAARFFHNFLLQMDHAKEARAYLHGRGLTNETIESWQIGYIPDQWDLLTRYLLKKGQGIDDLIASGITLKKEGAVSGSMRGFYDRFRGRIMFPIQDVHGTIVGFTGRLLHEEDAKGGKYVNTPQTVLYDKSKVLFGLDKAKQQVRQLDYIIVVEGQMDVITSHQAGCANVVASSGTALTEEQLKLIGRYTKNIRIAFDADSAGIKAAKRGVDLALSAGYAVSVIEIPPGQGKDPADCILKDKQAWLSAVEHHQHVMEWYFAKMLAGFAGAVIQDRQKAIDRLLAELARIPYAVERDHWLRQLSQQAQIDSDILRQDLKRVEFDQKADMRHADTRSKNRVPQRGEAGPSAAGGHAAGKTTARGSQDKLDILLDRLFSLVLHDQNLFTEINSDDFKKILSTRPLYKPLYGLLDKEYTNGERTSDIINIREQCAEQEIKELIDILLMKFELDFSHIQDFDPVQELSKLLAEIMRESTSAQKRLLERRITQAEEERNKELLDDLLQQYQSL